MLRYVYIGDVLENCGTCIKSTSIAFDPTSTVFYLVSTFILLLVVRTFDDRNLGESDPTSPRQDGDLYNIDVQSR